MTFCGRSCSIPSLKMLMNTICSTSRLSASSISLRHSEQAVVAEAAEASTTAAVCQMKSGESSNCGGSLNVVIVGPAYSETSRPMIVSTCSAARESILTSRAELIKAELDEVSGDIGATWRMAQRLLHSKYKAEECAKLMSTFSQFLSTRSTASATTFLYHYSQQVVECSNVRSSTLP